MSATVSVLGIRHHGPGSARAVAAALDELDPDCVLIEGPPELDALAGYARSPAFVLPVAALVYVTDDPERSSFYPYAVFSPEWVALQHALARDVTVGFCDLPAAHRLAPGDLGRRRARSVVDPMSTLAAVAGYDDPERWWEDAVEGRTGGGLALFDAVTELMTAVRAAADEHERDADPDADGTAPSIDDRREAAMRTRIRAALKAGHQRVAVICGAYHAPVLQPATFPTQAADRALLTNLPKVKVTATWVPWSTPRLAYASGYGAGVEAPGWYEHLFTEPAEPGETTSRAVRSWIVRTARALRHHGLDTSPAAAVEATRLAGTLATLRGRPSVGLAEVLDASRSVLCEGSDARLDTVARELLIGDRVGQVPAEVPMVPVARDLEQTCRRLRLTRTAAPRPLELDLRKPLHVERSTLLHRLLLLGIPWGEQFDVGRTTGSFREHWSLHWQPDFEVRLVEAAPLGATVAEAAAGAVVRRVQDAPDLRAVAQLIDRMVPADLPDAVRAALDAFADRAARQSDVTELLATVEPLAAVARYGNVRGVDQHLVGEVLDATVARIAVGLPAAVAGIDDDAAAALVGDLDATGRAVALMADPGRRSLWLDSLLAVARRADVPGLLVGRAIRALLDAGRLDRDEVGRRLSRTLSTAADAPFGARWLEGFLAGDAVVLLHDDVLLGVVDEWVAATPPTTFDDLLPLLRRTFASFPAPDRRALGVRVRDRDRSEMIAGDELDPHRTALVLPRLLELMGEPW